MVDRVPERRGAFSTGSEISAVRFLAGRQEAAPEYEHRRREHLPIRMEEVVHLPAAPMPAMAARHRVATCFRFIDLRYWKCLRLEQRDNCLAVLWHRNTLSD